MPSTKTRRKQRNRQRALDNTPKNGASGGRKIQSFQQDTARACAFPSGDLPPHLLPDGSIRQPARVVAAEWRDPADRAALERGSDGKRHARSIEGFRAIDSLDRLPLEVEHWKAARRLRTDWELGSGATSGAGTNERVDGGSLMPDLSAGQVEARRRYETVVRDIGRRASAYVLPVVLEGWTVADLVKRHGGNPMTIQGRVMAGLDRLYEAYFPRESAGETAAPVWTLAGEMAPDTGLPVERSGRYRV